MQVRRTLRRGAYMQGRRTLRRGAYMPRGCVQSNVHKVCWLREHTSVNKTNHTQHIHNIGSIWTHLQSSDIFKLLIFLSTRSNISLNETPADAYSWRIASSKSLDFFLEADVKIQTSVLYTSECLGR